MTQMGLKCANLVAKGFLILMGYKMGNNLQIEHQIKIPHWFVVFESHCKLAAMVMLDLFLWHEHNYTHKHTHTHICYLSATVCRQSYKYKYILHTGSRMH